MSAAAGRSQRLLRDLLPRRQLGPVSHRDQQEGAGPGLYLSAQFAMIREAGDESPAFF